MISEPYIRKKGNSFIIELKQDAKTVFLKTLPNARTLLELITGEASIDFISSKLKEKSKASENSRRPTSDDETSPQSDDEVRTTLINSPQEKDALQ